MSVGEILRGSLHLQRKFFVPITLAYALPTLPGAVFAMIDSTGTLSASLNGASEADLLGGLVPRLLLQYFLIYGGFFVSFTAITLCISDACFDVTPSLRRSFFRTRATLGSLLIVYVLLLFAAVLVLLLVLVISIALYKVAPPLLLAEAVIVAPPIVAFWLSTILSPVAVVLEGRSGLSSLRRSITLTRGYLFRLFAVMYVAATIYALAICLTAFLVFAASLWFQSIQTSQLVERVVVFVSAQLATWVTVPLFYIALVLTYFDLRARKEAYDGVAFAAELGT